MGCDIHAYLECRKGDGEVWRCIADVTLLRNRALFAAMAGVRAEAPEEVLLVPKGLPRDMDDLTGALGRVFEADSQTLNTFFHHHSWLTSEELARCLTHAGCDNDLDALEYHALLGALRAVEARGGQARIVFWFDS